jgi:hypothetical protein
MHPGGKSCFTHALSYVVDWTLFKSLLPTHSIFRCPTRFHVKKNILNWSNEACILRTSFLSLSLILRTRFSTHPDILILEFWRIPCSNVSQCASLESSSQIRWMLQSEVPLSPRPFLLPSSLRKPYITFMARPTSSARGQSSLRFFTTPPLYWLPPAWTMMRDGLKPSVFHLRLFTLGTCSRSDIPRTLERASAEFSISLDRIP